MAISIVDNYTIPGSGKKPEQQELRGADWYLMNQEEMECLWIMMYHSVKGMEESHVNELYNHLGDRLGLDWNDNSPGTTKRIEELLKTYARCL